MTDIQIKDGTILVMQTLGKIAMGIGWVPFRHYRNENKQRIPFNDCG